MQHAGREIAGAGKARLFIHGEYELERPVGNAAAVHHRQSRRRADAVVRSERRAAGFQPVAIADNRDGVAREIVIDVPIFHADHVQMALQRGDSGVFTARLCGLADHHIAGGIHRGCQTEARSLRQNVLARGSFVARSTGDLREGIEMDPDPARLEAFQCSGHMLL